jgi:hypothetical protein
VGYETVAKTEKGRASRAMTSRQIHAAIRNALDEVTHGLASGELDRTGRFYSDAEWKKLLKSSEIRKQKKPLRRQGNGRSTAHSS